MKIAEALIIALLIAVAAYLYHDDGVERLALSKAAADAVATVQARDIAAAAKAQADCLAANASALQAGEAVARLSAPHVRSDPKVQPMIRAADIQEAMQ